jgi:hypothetical protein
MPENPARLISNLKLHIMKKLISYYHVVLNLVKMTIAELVAFAFGLKTTGDPDATNPPYTDAQIQALATTVQNDLGARITDPNPTLTALQQQHVDALSRAIVANMYYVQMVANDKAAGNRAVFEQISRRIGFLPKKEADKHQRVFESLRSEQGSIHIRVHSEAKGHITNLFEYGITNAKGVMPAAWEPIIALPVTELIISGFTSGTIVGIRYGVILPPSHINLTVAKVAPLSPVANALPVNANGKVSIVHGTTYLHFSDVMYIVVP